MKQKTILAILSTFLTASAFAADKGHWGYTGHEGPDHWGDLSNEFATCSNGKNQSPIDLTNIIDAKLPNLNIAYKIGGSEIINNGHTIQINSSPGSSMSIDGRDYELKQVHFHSPSENTIEGMFYPMEGHFVHSDKNGNLAVIAVMFKMGDSNHELDKAWNTMPVKTGERHVFSDMLNFRELLPKELSHYRYNGSLTTPPCSEGVTWLVMKSIVTVSEEQVKKFVETIDGANNRPVQPINSRMVMQ